MQAGAIDLADTESVWRGNSNRVAGNFSCQLFSLTAGTVRDWRDHASAAAYNVHLWLPTPSLPQPT